MDRYPSRDAYILPVDPKRAAGHDLLRRIIPYHVIAEGWTMLDGEPYELLMGAEDSGRILWWVLDSAVDTGSLGGLKQVGVDDQVVSGMFGSDPFAL